MRWLLGFLVLATSPLGAQASPFLPLDHPLLPLAEHLIARGDIADPSPMIRPFRRSDLVAALDRAGLDPLTAAGRAAATLRAAFADSPDPNWVRVAPRAGIDAFSSARRDLLHPAGDGGVRPYVDAAVEGRFGNILLVSRPAAENRLKLDPDWSGRDVQRRKSQAYRFVEGYLAAQFSRVHLFFGQMPRNWGPAGSAGLGIADDGYPRTDLGLALVFRDFRVDVVGTQLAGMRAADGELRSRFFLAHRLNARLTPRLHLAIWETGVLSPDEGTFDPGFVNPMLLIAFPLQLGIADERNAIIGGDLAWRAGPVLLEGQAMIDDRWRRSPDPDGTGEIAHPGRWAATGSARGPLAGGAAWRAHATIVNSLAYRTTDSTENFVDRGLGIGPNFPDRIAAGLSVSFPVAGRWLVTPDLTWQWQGEGRLDTPFPTGQALTDTPELFIGTTERTVRAGMSVAGGTGRLQVAGSGGWFRISSVGHVSGAGRDRFEARLRAMVHFSKQGAIQ